MESWEHRRLSSLTARETGAALGFSMYDSEGLCLLYGTETDAVSGQQIRSPFSKRRGGQCQSSAPKGLLFQLLRVTFWPYADISQLCVEGNFSEGKNSCEVLYAGSEFSMNFSYVCSGTQSKSQGAQDTLPTCIHSPREHQPGKLSGTDLLKPKNLR